MIANIVFVFVDDRRVFADLRQIAVQIVCKITDAVRLVQLRELIEIIKGRRRRLFGRDGRLFVSRSSVRVGRQCDRLALRTICFVDSVADRIVAVGV